MRPRPSFSASPPRRLYRDPAAGKLFGVCAGLASFLGVDPGLVRIAMVVGLIFLSAPVLIGYGLAALILPARPPESYPSIHDEEFRRHAADQPRVTLDGVRQRFGDLEQRVRALESHVSGQEFLLSREIRNL
jgi:phage shock protein C